MGVPSELAKVRNASPGGTLASQAGVAAVGPAGIFNEADWADLLLSLIFRRGQSQNRFPRDRSVIETVSDFCRRHLISKTLVSALPDSELPRDTIAALTERMRKRCEQQEALHRHLATAIADIQPALDQEGISWRLMKGPRLQQAYYGALTREYFDLDILVPNRQFPRARRVLADLGWRARKRGFVPLRLVQGLEHGLGLQRGEAMVDLHWSLRVRPAYRIDEHRVFASAQKSHCAGIEVPVLDPNMI